MKLKRLIAAAGLATVLAIGVGTGITINREAERVDALAPVYSFGLAKDAASLDGKQGLIVAQPSGKAPQALSYDGTGFRKKVEVALTGTSIVTSVETNAEAKESALPYAITFTKLKNGNFNLGVIDGYLALNVDDNKLNTLGTLPSGNNTAEWKITIDTDGVATIIPAAYTGRAMKYNSSATRFACYKSGQSSVKIYVEQPKIEVTEVKIDAPASTNVLVGHDLTLTAVVEPKAQGVAQGVSWKLQNHKLADGTATTVARASISDTGVLSALEAGSVEVVATSSLDTTKSSAPLLLTIGANDFVKLEVTGTVEEQFVGTDFNTKGLTFKATRKDGSVEYPEATAITFDVKTIAKETKEIVATYEGCTATIKLNKVSEIAITTYKEFASDTVLRVGDRVVITNSDGTIIVGAQTKNNRGAHVKEGLVADATTLTLSDKDETAGATVLTVRPGTKENTFSFYDESAKGYLYCASKSKNYLRTGYLLNDAASWTVTLTSSGTLSIVSNVSAETTTRNILSYNESSKCFSCYSDPQTGGINMYVYKEADTKLAWAKEFLNTTTYECSQSKVTAPTWAKLQASFAALSADDKAFFKNIDLKDGLTDDLHEAVRRYEHILRVYPTFANFIERANAATTNVINTTNTNMIISIVAISTIAVSAIALLVIFKHRKATR